MFTFLVTLILFAYGAYMVFVLSIGLIGWVVFGIRDFLRKHFGETKEQ